MKKFILILLALVLSFSANAQVIKEGNNFKVEQSEKSKVSNTKTDFTYEIKGIKYPIYISSRSSLFIIKKSKSGKEYKYYIPKEISNQIKKELKK